MQVIDLDTGKLIDAEPSIAGQLPAQQPMQSNIGGIIDLDTGKIVSEVEAPAIEQPAPEAPARKLSEIIPDVAGKVSDTVSEISAPETGIGDFFTGSERIKATPELGTAPEFALTPEADSLTAALEGGDTETANKISLGLISTFDPKAQIEMIQSAIPEATFETTPDGSTFIEVPTADGGIRRSVLNRPGLSAQDIRGGLAQVLAFIPAGKMAALGKTILTKMGISFAAGGATEQALQEGGIEFLGRESRDPVATLTAGVGGVAGEAIPAAVQGVRQGRQAAKLGVEKAEIEAAKKSVEPAQKAIKHIEEITGVKVGLFPAQQTLTPSELLKQRILPQLDAGARKAAAALKGQNKQVSDAVDSVINLVAPEKNIVGGSKRFKEAAETAMQTAKDARSNAVRPLYKRAFETAKGKQVDLEPVSEFVKNELENLVSDDPAATALKAFVERITPAKGAKPLSLEQLQSAKRTTDAIIDKDGGLVPNAAQKNAKRLLAQAEKLYVDQLGKLSPEFAAANKEFSRLSKPVNELSDSLIGEVIKISDDKLRNVSTTIFNPKEATTSPVSIAQAREVISKTSPDSWNDILRVELERRVGGAGQLAEDFPELADNGPGLLKRALFGNPKQRKALYAGLNKEQKKNFTYLEELLKRSDAGRAAGSPTAGFAMALKKLEGTAVVLRDMVFKPLESLQKTGEAAIFDRNVAALTEAMFNPKFAPKLTELRKLSPNSPAAARALTQLIKAKKEESEQ